MDTTHINSISKKISMLPWDPCCMAEEVDFERLPSSLNYTILVDALPCFNPSNDPSYQPHDSREGKFEAFANYEAFCESKPIRPRQVKALDTFWLIHSTVARTLSHRHVNLDTVKQYAACFDDFFFEGKLLQRCSIEWVMEKQIVERNLTRHQWDCKQHQQCHTVRILLLRPPASRHKAKALAPKWVLDHTLNCLLHEMSHAWVEIFSTSQRISFEDAIEEMGPTGHGKAWKNVYRMCVWAAQDYFGLVCDDTRDWLLDEDNDTKIVRNMEALLAINMKATSPAVFVELISERLDIPLEHVRLFPKLLENGLEMMEALLVVWGSFLVLWVKPDLNVMDMLPADWHWK